MILKNLWFRKTRTLLTVLGIAVGVAAVVSFSAFAEGFATGFDRAFSSANADLTVVQKDALATIFSGLDESLAAELRQMPGVSHVSGTVTGVVQMPEAPYFIVSGEDPRGVKIGHYRLIEGGPLSGRRQILLGKLAAKSFKKQVGDSFRLNGLTYRVVGIYETGTGLEDGGAVITLADAQRAFDKRRQVSYFNVMVKEARRIDEVKEQIEARWPDLSATRSGEPTRQSEMMDMTRSFGWFLGIFAVFVGGLGMMNTSLMSVFERTREIGVLRAVGWRRRRVIGMVLGESVVLALIGGGLGVALGIGLTALVRLSPSVESLLQGTITPTILLQAVATALLLGSVGGLYPAWRAAQLAPVEAMRAEGGAAVRFGRASRALTRLPGTGALRSLWRRPTRTLVTAAGLGLGVGFVVMLLAISDGVRVAFTQIAGAGQADLVAEQANASDISFSAIDERVAQRIEAQPEVRSVSRIVLGISSGPGVPFFLVFGLDPREEYIQRYRIREGRAIQRPREALLGRQAANSLKKGVGDRMQLSGASYLVVGIYENGLAFEDSGGVIALREAQPLFGKQRQASLLAITLQDPKQADEMARRLEARFPEVIVSKPSGLTERMQDFATLDAMLGALVALTVVVGGIVMMNAMLMSVFERTQEIGVLRALGWRRRRVLGMVMAESLALSALSAVAGMVLGVGLSFLLTYEPAFGSFLTPAYSPGHLIAALLLALALGALGGLYPAWRATGLQPVEALRYE